MARTKSEVIILRCTPALKARAQMEAEARGVSLSEFITDTLKAEIIPQEMRNTQVEHKEQ